MWCHLPVSNVLFSGGCNFEKSENAMREIFIQSKHYNLLNRNSLMNLIFCHLSLADLKTKNFKVTATKVRNVRLPCFSRF